MRNILHLRSVTRNVCDTIFQMGKKKLHVIDVSGLSHHRNGWVSYFDDVKAILFVASLSCYDQVMMEEEGVNRMVDSLVLFEEMVNHELLKKKDFIFFLNKKDLFEKKIKKKHIVDYFPQYKGKRGSASQGIKYFNSKFRDQNKTEKAIITHITCCTDTKVMEVIVSAVLTSILGSQMDKERKEYERYKEEPKLLLLGSSDSGKSTLLKQLKILHGGGFGEKEKELSRKRIIGGIFRAITTLVNSIAEFELMHVKESYQELLLWYEDWNGAEMPITPEILAKTKAAWSEGTVRGIFESGKVLLPDTTSYFMDSIDRILAPSYSPTNSDILNLRTVTQSVSDTVFQVDGQRLHVLDVSGLSHHRNGWMSYFEDVHSVIFVASLSSYDQMMVEEPDVNRMVDSIVLFEEMVNHKMLKNKFFILFLNKKDLYEQKIRRKDIVNYFPNYKGKKGSLSQGIKYFEAKFRDQNKFPKEIVTHITCCTDSEIMKVIIQGVLTSIMSGQMKAAGFST
ncbi:hypothetical protein HDV03_002424 [Kappamyces sp. JEL0829]|nr:hypothetical protein HDV03_002424 [Kappamyces sp. JEL0829]